MTFKKYLDGIQGKIYSITEDCNGRRVSTHLVFGFNQDDGDTSFEKNGIIIETKDDFILYGPDGYEVAIFIDTAQQIELKNDSVCVTDRNGNRIELTFFAVTVIPHPTE